LNDLEFDEHLIFSKINIEWHSYGIENLDIEYSVDSGKNWIDIITEYPAESEHYLWTIPYTLSDSCYIRVLDSEVKEFADTVDNHFKIYKDSLRIIKPNGTEYIEANTRYLVKWEGEPFEDVKFELTTNGGRKWEEIEIEPPSNPNYKFVGYWNLLDYDSSSITCKIRITDLKDSSNHDESDGYFAIYSFVPVAEDYISANECRMWIGNNGMSSHNPLSDDSGFYWPGGKDATISSIFADGILWGGYHEGMIKVNGSTYRHGLTPGKILENGDADNPLDPRYGIFKIHKNWELMPEGEEKEQYEYDYENWPGDLGAPYIDINHDGIFTKGIDVPDFIGDEVLFYVSNDLDSFN
jgi:hypothetical protein